MLSYISFPFAHAHHAALEMGFGWRGMRMINRQAKTLGHVVLRHFVGEVYGGEILKLWLTVRVKLDLIKRPGI